MVVILKCNYDLYNKDIQFWYSFLDICAIKDSSNTLEALGGVGIYAVINQIHYEK